MYETFFGFSERPFDLTPSPKFLVLIESHREALRNLEYAIASRKGLTLLIGEAGVGKTTIIRSAIDRQPERVHCVHLHNPTLSRAEFVQMLAGRFGLSNRAAESKTVMLGELEEQLLQRRRHDETTVLIVDEAQSLPLDLLEEIRLLANIETDAEKLLTVIIAGQPELSDRLNRKELRQLKQRVALRCELSTLSAVQTAEYLAGRIRAAGAVASQVLTREAVRAIHEGARGVPRTINVIADNALLGGFAAGTRPVPRAIVEEVCRDFDLAIPSGRPAVDRPPARRAQASGPAMVSSHRPDLVTRSMMRQEESSVAPAVGQDRPLFGDFTKRRRFTFFS